MTSDILHSPIRASLRQPHSDTIPGICESINPGHLGWFVPVRERNGARDVIIRLWVHDPKSSFTGFVPFLIDTGSQMTVLPRAALRGPSSSAAFRVPRRRRMLTVQTPGGPVALGESFTASLMLMPSGGVPECNLGEVPVTIAESWPEDFPAILGMDVLRKLIVIADANHVTLWQHPHGGTDARPAMVE